MNTGLEAHKCGIGVLTREALVPIGSGPNKGHILIPPTAAALILKILRQYHDSPLAGHYGVARTQAPMGLYFKWQGLATTVKAYVRSCDACQRNKVARHAPYGLLNPLPIPAKPWSSVSLDWITDLPPN